MESSQQNEPEREDMPGVCELDKQRPKRLWLTVLRIPLIGHVARFMVWWLGLTGFASWAAVCPFCGQPGCVQGAAGAGLIGAVLAMWVRVRGKCSLSGNTAGKDAPGTENDHRHENEPVEPLSDNL